MILFLSNDDSQNFRTSVPRANEGNISKTFSHLSIKLLIEKRQEYNLIIQIKLLICCFGIANHFQNNSFRRIFSGA